MRFPNGYNGVKKVFTAELLAMIGNVLALIAAIVGMVMLSATGDNTDAALASIGVYGIISIIAGIIAIVATILKLVGLSQAGKDDKQFKIAFIISICALLLIVVTTIVKIFVTSGIVDDIFDLLQRIATIVVIFLVIGGIQSFAIRLGDEKMLKKGNSIAWLIAIPYILGLLAALIGVIFGASNASTTIISVLGIVGAVLTVVGSIIYLVYLGQAKNMLAEK